MKCANKKVLAKLLSFHSASCRGCDFEAVAQDAGNGLEGDDLAVAIERESNDMLRVLVPGDSAPGVHQIRSYLRENIYYARSLAAHQQPFPQIGADAQGDALEALTPVIRAQVPAPCPIHHVLTILHRPLMTTICVQTP